MTNPTAIGLCTFFAVSLAAAAVTAQALPEGPGKSEVVRVCGACHVAESTGREFARRQSADQWSKVLFRMLDFGAEMNKEQQNLILAYLTANFGLGTPVRPPQKVNVNKATAKELETSLALTASQAEAVVKYRQTHGDFKEWRDLTKVEGLDAKKIEAAKDQILTADATNPTPKP